MSKSPLRTSVRTIAPLVGVCAAILAASPAAGAATELHVNPSTVPAGQSVQVSGSCEANTTGFALSTAFLHDASHDFAGVGAVSFSTDATGAFSAQASIPASISPGTYPVTARCGGGNLGISPRPCRHSSRQLAGRRAGKARARSCEQFVPALMIGRFA